MSFLLLILIILFVVVGWPVIRTLWAVHNYRRQVRKAFEQARARSQQTEDAYRQAYERAYGQTYRQGYRQQRTSGGGAQQTRGSWSYTRRPKRKIFTREMGEYVKWEELPPLPNQPADTARYYGVTEQQIVDVEWEDVK